MLEASEQNHASEPVAPRRVSASPRRRLSREFNEEFEDDFNDDEDAPMERRFGGSGVRLRFSGFPRTAKGRVAAGIALLLCLGICFAAFALARTVILHDERFFIPSASAIEFEGNVHVTRDQLLNVFGEDIERNIFSVPLAERRTEVEKIPWVGHATVMRLLPNRLRVSLIERTPVAFVRQGNHIGLVDAAGVLLDMPPDVRSTHYSFPVVSGISPNDPLSTRAARMKIYNRFTNDLDGSGEKISQELSEVDLSNPEDVKALIPDKTSDILVHFGESDFLDRYRRFKEHLQEWRTLYPKLSSVDMRYERQVVLEMQPGSTVPTPAEGSVDNTPQKIQPLTSAEPATHAPKKPSAESPAKPRAVAAAKRPAPAKTKTPPHVTARNDVAFDVPAKKTAAKPKPHKPEEKHHPAVVRSKEKTPLYHPPRVVHP